MTEAASSGGRAEMERRLLQRSLAEEAFRQRLLEEPKAVVEEELGTRLPEGIRVVAVEETAQTIYLVLPSASPLGDELSEEELEAVAAGWEATEAASSCSTCDGNVANTCRTCNNRLLIRSAPRVTRPRRRHVIATLGQEV